MKPLDDKKLAQIRREFDYFDKDSSGQLDKSEFRQLFAILAPDAKRSEADEGFAAIDEDGSGSIEFDEFVDWWQSNWLVY